MTIKMLKAALVGLVLSVSGFANAGIITSDYLNVNDGLLTQDANNNLEWLDVSLFTGMNLSTKTELTPYINDGFRLATASELLGLYVSSGVDNVISYENGIRTHLYGTDNSEFYNVLTTAGKSNLTSLFHMLRGDTNAYVGNSWIHGILVDENNNGNHYLGRLRIGVTTSAAHVNTNSDIWGTSNVSNGAVGAYMVREINSVPEPSTLAIFALGMIGLASRRFKKQS
jgi:hypothetical protein